MRHALSLIVILLTAPSVSCLSRALAADKVNWREKCSAPCAQAFEITIYTPDNKVEIYRVAVYSLNPPVGCICPSEKKTRQ